MIIYSKKNKKKIVGIIFRLNKTKKNRTDISPEKEYLQFSAQKLKTNAIVRPHIHKKILRKTNITQEIWIVVQGKILITVYDTDKKILKKTFLQNGDLFILFRGGHTFKVKKKNNIL